MTEHYMISENESLETKFEFLKDVPGYYGVENITFHFKSISSSLATMLGWNQIEQAINKSFYDIPSKAVEAVSLYKKSSNICERSLRPITVIQIVMCNHKIYSLIAQKTPIMDTRNNIVGVFFSGIDIANLIQKEYRWLDDSDSQFINYKSVPRQYILTPEASTLPLTQRQQECLALLIRGKTYKEIAYMLGISNRVVEDHIHAIKYKLGCYNKSQLIEKAIDSGFLFHVPETLFGLLK